MPELRKIEVLDTTLRDGVQAAGVIFSIEDKIKLLRALDNLGVDYIEAGNPAANPKDLELFQYAKSGMQLQNAKLCAFGMTCRPGAAPENDPALRVLAECGAQAVSIVGKSSSMQVRDVLMQPPEENLRMIEETVRFLAQRGMDVFFDAEHFFDGWKIGDGYALETLRAAARGGAKRLVLCDTNGGCLPEEIADTITRVIQQIDVPVAIHCHNDSGLATAGTLAGVRAGCVQVQGTVNGYGERCGNANLCEVIPNLAIKLGYSVLAPDKLADISSIARYIAELANLNMDDAMPFVGRNAFAHKGGLHIDGVLKNCATFEHIDPAVVGNSRRVLISEFAGKSALMTRLSRIAPELTRESETTRAILEQIKALEKEGYSFENADASLSLRILDALGRRPDYFRVLDFHIVARQGEDERCAQAYVKVEVGGQVEITADEGVGPVNALDRALRKALMRFYPVLSEMRLADFKVRVVATYGSASVVRVHIDSTDGESIFSTVGVSPNIIEASFIAVTDSIESFLMKRNPSGEYSHSEEYNV